MGREQRCAASIRPVILSVNSPYKVILYRQLMLSAIRKFKVPHCFTEHIHKGRLIRLMEPNMDTLRPCSVPTQILFSNSLRFPCPTGNFPCSDFWTWRTHSVLKKKLGSFATNSATSLIFRIREFSKQNSLRINTPDISLTLKQQ